MSNWSKLQEDTIGLPVYKRAKHGVHFRNPDKTITAVFSATPCNFFDADGLWKPIDTKPLLRKDGTFGCPHSDVIIHPDGTVQVGEYYQKAALIYPQSLKVDGDRLVREFTGGRQYLYITENGFRQEIVLDKLPDLKKVSALVDTVSGVLPSKYTASSLSLKDSSTAEFSDFVQVDSKSLVSVLEAAKYPVVIDPDFSAETGATIYCIWGNGQYGEAAYASWTTSNWDSADVMAGQQWTGTRYWVYRSYLKFDTSSIGSSIVSQVNLKLTCTNDYSDTDFDVIIKKCDWSGTDPIVRATNRETAWDNCYSSDADSSIWRNTSGISTNTTYTSVNLSNAWIETSGNTYYGIMGSRDGATSPYYGLEYIKFATPAHATESYRPVLSVTYTAAGNPFYYFRQQQ